MFCCHFEKVVSVFVGIMLLFVVLARRVKCEARSACRLRLSGASHDRFPPIKIARKDPCVCSWEPIVLPPPQKNVKSASLHCRLRIQVSDCVLGMHIIES